MKEAAGYGIIAVVLIIIMVLIMAFGNVHTEIIPPNQCWDKGGFWSKGVCYTNEDGVL